MFSAEHLFHQHQKGLPRDQVHTFTIGTECFEGNISCNN